MDFVFIFIASILFIFLFSLIIIDLNRNYIYITDLRSNISQTEIEKEKQQKLQRVALRKKMSLENGYCKILLSQSADMIYVIEKNPALKHRTFTYISDKRTGEVWDRLCNSFIYYSNYDSIKNIFENELRIRIKEQIVYDERQIKKLTDINNCSEKELRELPGINIIYAKRIIKRRDEIGGFKNSEEFFDYTKVTDDIKKQLSSILIFKKIEKTEIEKFDERNVDL
ncbi:helix-hairpin-helix domain-containing protein [bacterium]|nr:helix-hairpin-helix domain-containing protein [bacterium]